MVLAVPTQDTFTVGEVLTAALMNKNVRDAVNFLANPPIAVCYQGTSQSIPNGTSFGPVTFDSEVIDTYNGHSVASNTSRYTAVVAGWYLVVASVAWTSSSAGVRGMVITVNGSQVAYFPHRDAGASQTQYWEIIALVNLNVGDYVEEQVFQNSGAAMSLVAGASGMGVLWVHA